MQFLSRSCFKVIFGILLGIPSLGSAQVQKKAVPGAGGNAGSGDEKQTILFLGNSLSAGYGLDPDQSFPNLIQQKIDSLGWPFHVINAGLTGDTSSGGARRIKWLLRQRIDFLVLELGGNDGLRGIPLAETRKNLQAIIDHTQEAYPHCQIVIAGMQVPPNMGERYAQGFRSIFEDLAESNEAALIPFLLEGVGGIPRLNLPDRVHPTAEGYRIVAVNVWSVLGPVLRKTLPKNIKTIGN